MVKAPGVKAPGLNTLEIEVTDFGPIVEAKIDLRPLTVFIGPSNTGKSYLAILIYALHRYFSGGASPVAGYYRRYRRQGAPPTEAINAFREMARSFLDSQEHTAKKGVILPPPVADLIRSGADEEADALAHEISRCFGIDGAGALVRKGRRDGARIALRRRVSEGPACFEHRLTLAAGTKTFRATVPEEIPVRIETEDAQELVELVDIMESEERGYAAWRLMRILDRLVLPSSVGPLHLPAYYLPADRTGVMHAHSVVVSALIESAPTAGLRPSARTPMLSGVLADFLEQLIEIDRPPYPHHRRRAARNDLGAGIEGAILHGKVRIDRSLTIDYPRFTYRPEGWKSDLPLMNASSMVSELAPVVLYLKHMVAPDSVLIVEEPESHLHPAMQVEFTRQLATFVDAGIRVIVTTHSEWLLEELANIVRRSELLKGDVPDNRIALRPDQVGAWLFQPKSRPRGSVVTEIGLTGSGLYPSGFDEVAAALHNDWAEISSRIEDAG